MEVMGKVLAVLIIVIAGLAVGMNIMNQYTVDQQRVQSVSAPSIEQVSLVAGQNTNFANTRVVASTVTLVNATCESVCTSSPNSTLRQGSEYTISTSPTLSYIHSVNRTGTFNATYQWLPSAYVGGTGSTILGIMGAIFAVVILLMVYRKLLGNAE